MKNMAVKKTIPTLGWKIEVMLTKNQADDVLTQLTLHLTLEKTVSQTPWAQGAPFQHHRLHPYLPETEVSNQNQRHVTPKPADRFVFDVF